MLIHPVQHTTHARHRPISMKGFTLIELMITIAIIAILASIAFPAYQNSVLKAGRSDGKVSLLSAAQAMERCFTTNNAYTGCAVPATSGEGKYTLAVVIPVPGIAFTITATRAGNQLGDTECGDLTLTHTGQQAIINSDDNNANLDICW